MCCLKFIATYNQIELGTKALMHVGSQELIEHTDWLNRAHRLATANCINLCLNDDQRVSGVTREPKIGHR